MMIGYYITELLADNNYVVLPGIGAFTARPKTAYFDTNSQILYPPSRLIFFNPDIKINDGVLLQHIAKAQKLSAPQANKQLQQLCDDIQYRLDHGETISLEGLGKLSRIDNQYHFVSVEGAEISPEAFGLEALHMASLVRKPELPPETKPPVKLEPSEDTDKTLPRNKKKKSRKALYWLLLIPFIVTAVWLYWANVNQKPTIADKVETVPLREPEIAHLPETIDDITESDEEQQFAGEVDIGPLHPRHGVYYLVGGSFLTRENAEKYFEQISGRGHEPIHLGEIGSFHLVAMAVFDTEREAYIAQMNILRRDSTAGVWVYFIREAAQEEN
jgi:nucleoid DNA-binding protein